jgi:hypothetical protein
MKTRIGKVTFGMLGAVMLLAASSVQMVSAQTAPTSQERWLHVRVDSTEANGDTVRVNVPLSLAEKVLGAVDQRRFHNGRISVGHGDLNGVDLKAMLDAVRSSKDGEFVTVTTRDEDVRVAKQNGVLLIHALDKHAGKNGDNVDVRIPLTVADALLTHGSQELDIVAAIHILSSTGDTELVSVKDGNNTVRVWLDTKSSSD